MKIYVDADACPVKEVVIEEGRKAQVLIVMVKSFSHFSHERDPLGVETIYVDSGTDAADYRIMKLAKAKDIIITQDYGLASLGLARGCIVLHHTGYAYTSEQIDQMLQVRHLHAKARRSGQKTKGPKSFTGEERERFRELLRSCLAKSKPS